jgi:hypothetical protein
MEPHEWQKLHEQAHAAFGTPEYLEYHKKVVEEGVARTDEAMRTHWEGMSYEMEFVEGESVEDCVTGNIEAMEGDQ